MEAFVAVERLSPDRLACLQESWTVTFLALVHCLYVECPNGSWVVAPQRDPYEMSESRKQVRRSDQSAESLRHQASVILNATVSVRTFATGLCLYLCPSLVRLFRCPAYVLRLEQAKATAVIHACTRPSSWL